MFNGLLLHPESQKTVEHLLQHPSHAILIEGPANIGKHLIAREIAAVLLGVSPEKLSSVGMYRELFVDNMSITIEQIRELIQFFSLKTLGDKSIQRVALIPDAELLSHPAQNALLKVLEEPPADSVIVLTSSFGHKLLPTITSRTQRIMLRKPSTEAIQSMLTGSYADTEISRALVLGEGRIGAVYDHLKMQPTEGMIDFTEAKRILGLPLFDQLLLIDTILKDKIVASQFVDLLAQISAASFLQTATNPKAAAQWQRISRASYVASNALSRNANQKLVLTELMLSLRD